MWEPSVRPRGKKQSGWWEDGKRVQVRVVGKKMCLQTPGVKTLETKIINRITPEPATNEKN